MKAIRVQYTVREDFAETNKANIAAVMEELRAKGDCGVKYASYVKEDGRTFVHVVMLRNDEAQSVVGSLEAFGRFQAALKEGAEIPPKPEHWTVVGSNYDP